MATCEVIELKRVADLPTGHGMFCKTDCKTAQEALQWAEKLGAECVYLFTQKNGAMLAWVLNSRIVSEMERE